MKFSQIFGIILLATHFLWAGEKSPTVPEDNERYQLEGFYSQSIPGRECWIDYRRLHFEDVPLNEKNKMLERALAKMEAGVCDYCPNLFLYLLNEEHLESKELKLVERVEKLLTAKNHCAIYLLPEFINNYKKLDFSSFLEPLYSKIVVDLNSPVERLPRAELIVEKLILATLLNNTGHTESGQFIVKILSSLKNETYESYHRQFLEVVIVCKPVNKDLLVEIIQQGLEMRKINLSYKEVDVIPPNYQRELSLLKTIPEWNQYMKRKNVETNDSFVYDNWDANGTIDFLRRLVKDGFTAIKE